MSLATETVDTYDISPALRNRLGLGRLQTIAVVPSLRKEFLDQLQSRCQAAVQPTFVDEVIIGGGISAASYCAMRPTATRLVLDPGRLGGIFAVPERPVFYLNSRNRPESEAPEKGPGTRAPLNYIPEGIIQPADLDVREYQSQDVLAFVAAVNLAHNITAIRRESVFLVRKVDPRGIRDAEKRYLVGTTSGNYQARRVVIATGLGDDDVEKIDIDEKTPNILTFTDFLRVMGAEINVRPLEGWQRVAVVGTGDSGNVVVEYLMGQGPDSGYSTASEDAVSHVSWIGQECKTREQFARRSRSRYAGIARFFPRFDQPQYPYKIVPRSGRVTSVGAAPENRVKLCWRIGSRFFSDVFDKVVLCTGFKPVIPKLEMLPPETVVVDGCAIGKKVPGEEVYLIGPCAQLPVESRERKENQALVNIPANSAALFRYSDRIAMLAQTT